MPAAQSHKAWQWNYTRAERQPKLGGAKFLPRIMYFAMTGQARTLVVWGEAVPALLLKVDFVLVGRGQGGEQVFGLSSWQQLTEILNDAGYSSGDEGFNLDYIITPRPIMDFVTKIRPIELSSLSMLAPDKVLDEELVRSARARR